MPKTLIVYAVSEGDFMKVEWGSQLDFYKKVASETANWVALVEIKQDYDRTLGRSREV